MNDNDIKEREKEIRNDLLENRRKLVIAIITVTIPILAMFISFVYQEKLANAISFLQAVLYTAVLMLSFWGEFRMIIYLWFTRKE